MRFRRQIARYERSEDMTVRDLILMAGGTTRNPDFMVCEVSRGRGTTSVVLRPDAMSGATYSTYEIRVHAVRAVIEEGLPVTVTAQAYGTDRSTIHRWISRYQDGGEPGLLRKPVRDVPESSMRSIKMHSGTSWWPQLATTGSKPTSGRRGG